MPDIVWVILGAVLIILGLLFIVLGFAGAVLQLKNRRRGFQEITDFMQAVAALIDALGRAPQWLSLVVVGLALIILGSLFAGFHVSNLV